MTANPTKTGLLPAASEAIALRIMTNDDEEMTNGEMTNGEIETTDKEMAMAVAIEDGRMETGMAMEDIEIKRQGQNLVAKSKHNYIEYGPMVRDVIGQLKSISYELDNDDNKNLYESLTSVLIMSEQKKEKRRFDTTFDETKNNKKKRSTNIRNFL